MKSKCPQPNHCETHDIFYSLLFIPSSAKLLSAASGLSGPTSDNINLNLYYNYGYPVCVLVGQMTRIARGILLLKDRMELTSTTLNEFFKSEEDCVEYLIKQRWPNGVACIRCGSLSLYNIKRRHAFECKDCGKQFNPRTGTPFENSQIPLLLWYRALYLLTSNKKGISSIHLAHELGVNQKTAWRMLHALREVMHLDEQLEGRAQVDETYFTPIAYRRTDARYRKQVAVIGIVEESKGRSRIRTLVTKQPDASVALPFIRATLKPGSSVSTDGSRIYYRLHREFPHQWVNHSRWQWMNGEATTNAIENFWSHLKRGIRAIYIHVSQKHLQKYCDEYSFRFNTRWMSQWQRFDEWFKGIDRPKQSLRLPIQMKFPFA